MQDRYAGDIGDYGKLGLLRKMSEKFSIGINWYNPGELDFERDKNGKFKQEDGKYRDFKSVKEFDDKLASALETLKGNHSIEMLEKLDLVNNAVYQNKLVPRENAKRDKWHRAALKKLGECDIVFLDPDNGLLCNSVKTGSPLSVKYTYYSEVKDYLSQNKAVIIYNHRSRKKEDLYFSEIIEKLCVETGAERDLIQVVTLRRFSVRDYFIISKDEHTYNAIRSLVEELVKNCSNDNKPFCTFSDVKRAPQISDIFKNKVAVVTGGANGIGKCIAEEFRKNGATVCVIDKVEGDHFVGDISDKTMLEKFAEQVITGHGHIDFLVNNALPLMKGIDECSYEEFQYALAVGVTAPFYLSKLFAPHFNKGGSIINISSSRDRMSQPQTESYTAAKGGIASLTHALAVSLAGKVRVNSISPGWIDTAYKVYEGPDAYQQPCGRVGNPLDIANMVMFLCSDKAGFITGENICIDGGMTKRMIYHGDNGWKLE